LLFVSYKTFCRQLPTPGEFPAVPSASEILLIIESILLTLNTLSVYMIEIFVNKIYSIFSTINFFTKFEITSHSVKHNILLTADLL